MGSTMRTLHFTLTYRLDGKSEERSVFVSAELPWSGEIVTIETRVEGYGKKKTKLRRKHIPANSTLVKEAYNQAKKLLPRNATKINYKNVRG